jgi:hypothetical protein
MTRPHSSRTSDASRVITSCATLIAFGAVFAPISWFAGAHRSAGVCVASTGFALALLQ